MTKYQLRRLNETLNDLNSLLFNAKFLGLSERQVHSIRFATKLLYQLKYGPTRAINNVALVIAKKV